MGIKGLTGHYATEKQGNKKFISEALKVKIIIIDILSFSLMNKTIILKNKCPP